MRERERKRERFKERSVLWSFEGAEGIRGRGFDLMLFLRLGDN